jgi:hypothetical protein
VIARIPEFFAAFHPTRRVDMGAIERAIKTFETTGKAFHEGMASQIKPDHMSSRFLENPRMTDPRDLAEELIIKSQSRLQPVSYSADLAWRNRLAQFRDVVVLDPKLSPALRDILSGATKAMEGTGLEARLRDFLLEADPFKEKYDLDRIAKSGEFLLQAITNTVKLTAVDPLAAQLQPDLVVLTDWARGRMEQMTGSSRRTPAATNLTNQMYLELQRAIGGEVRNIQDRVQQFSKRRDDYEPDAFFEDWKDKLSDLNSDVVGRLKKKESLYEIWADTCQNQLLAHPRSDPAWKVYLYPELNGQLSRLKAAMEGPLSTDADLMKVRSAASDVQNTIKFLADTLATDMSMSFGTVRRDVLDRTLCVLSEWVLKDVNFILLGK